MSFPEKIYLLIKLSFLRFNRPDIRKSFLNKVLSLDNDDEKSQNIEDTNIDENVDNKKELVKSL